MASVTAIAAMAWKEGKASIANRMNPKGWVKRQGFFPKALVAAPGTSGNGLFAGLPHERNKR
ncbi:hypothetical protein [Altererythrobacter sp. Z27]|uniref:hypothetical protein n=1 Tax=Altererythrobacter sp. Z27 TaxID=3461147 RepID=UPI0040439942